MARVHSRELKLEVCRQIAAGVKRPAQICREHQLANSLLARWRQEYAQRGDAAFTPRAPDGPAALEARIAELERACGQLAAENLALKKPCNSFSCGASRRDWAVTSPDPRFATRLVPPAGG